MKQNGFTLIEMMITVVIVAILATIAYPSYDRFIKKTRLENARADLMEAAQMLERHYSKKKSFCNIVVPTAPNADCHTNPSIPASSLPNERSKNFFLITYANKSPTPSDYEIRAIPLANTDETRFIVYDNRNSMLLCEDANNCAPY